MIKSRLTYGGNAVRGFGVFVLIIGVLALIGAMSMDVTVLFT